MCASVSRTEEKLEFSPSVNCSGVSTSHAPSVRRFAHWLYVKSSVINCAGSGIVVGIGDGVGEDIGFSSRSGILVRVGSGRRGANADDHSSVQTGAIDVGVGFGTSASTPRQPTDLPFTAPITARNST